MSTENTPNIEARLKHLEETLQALVSLFLKHSDDSVKSSKTIDNNFESINEQLAWVDRKVQQLINASNKEFKNVGNKLVGIKDELYKIQKVSNYSEEYENLLKIIRK